MKTAGRLPDGFSFAATKGAMSPQPRVDDVDVTPVTKCLIK